MEPPETKRPPAVRSGKPALPANQDSRVSSAVQPAG